MPQQQFLNLAHLVRIGVAARESEIAQGHVDDLHGVLEHVDAALEHVRWIEEDGQRVNVAIVDVGIHIETRGAPHPGNGVVTARIPVDIDPAWFDVLEVGKLVGLDTQKQIFLDQDLDEIVARHDDVVARRSGHHLGEQVFVACERIDVDRDPGLGFELLDQLGAGVVRPGVEVHLSLGAGPGDAKRGDQQDGPRHAKQMSQHD